MERVQLIQTQVSSAVAKAVNENSLPGCSDASGMRKPFKTAERVLYITGEIKHAGSKEYFAEITKREVGVTNFDGNKLNVGRNATATHVSFKYDVVTAAENDGAWDDVVKGLAYDKPAPGQLLNAEASFEDDVKPLIVLPVSEMHNVETGRNNEDAFRALGDLRIIEAERTLRFVVNIPAVAKGGLDFATKRHFFKLAIRVGETVQR